MVNLHFDRSDSKKAILAAGFFSAAGMGIWLLIQLAVKRISGSERPINLDSAALFLIIPISLFSDSLFKRRYLFYVIALIVSVTINATLGTTPFGLLAHWLMFTLFFLCMERADYAAQTKPTDPNKLPAGQI